MYASTIPPVDLPATAFNEADAPVNLAPPSLPRFKFAPPVSNLILLPSLSARCERCGIQSWTPDPVATQGQRNPHRLQYLLCTFLI